MCRFTSGKVQDVSKNDGVRVMVSLDSYCTNGGTPNFQSVVVTGIAVIAFLTSCEILLREFFTSYQYLHPLLENETNRNILARHIGVDFHSCLICTILGITAAPASCRDMLDALVGKKGAMTPAGHEKRLFTFSPAGYRLCLFFFSYQVKNLVDTILWNDGALFIFHHVFCLFVSYGALSVGLAHAYAPFFFGFSELSTGVLCVLANFDDEHGVPGLSDAFPLTKVSVGGIFALCFIVCRVVLWIFFSYHFYNDCTLALNGDSPRAKSRTMWIKVFMFSLTFLSGLQVLWLGQIFLVAKEEIEKLGAL